MLKIFVDYSSKQSDKIMESLNVLSNLIMNFLEKMNDVSPGRKRPNKNDGIRFSFMFLVSARGSFPFCRMFCFAPLFCILFIIFMDISVLQRNCRSIVSKQTQLKCPLFTTVDVLVLPETFLTPNKSLVIPGIKRIWPTWWLACYCYECRLVFSVVNCNNLGLTNELMGIRIFPRSVPLNVVIIYSFSGLIVADLTKV